MIRIAISDRDSRCHCWEDDGMKDKDYCSHCQYVYSSETEYRLDYADETIAWSETEAEAREIISRLKPY